MFQGEARPKTYLCTCRSHCRVFNRSSGEYEGPGTMQSRNTRNNHRRDDMRLDSQQAATSPGQRSRLPIFRHPRVNEQIYTPPASGRSPFSLFRRQQPNRSIDPHPVTQPAAASQGAEAHWSIIIGQELELLSELPTTSVENQLVFCNEPAANGEYIRPPPAELIRPNHGLYALVPRLRANCAFLTTENRLCELLNEVSAIEVSEERDALCSRLYDQLGRLAQEKEYSWAQRRAHLTPGKILVNTEIHFHKRGPHNLTSKAAALVSLAMELLFFTPRRALRAQLAGQKDVLRESHVPSATLSQIPKEPRSISSHFGLNPVTRQFLSCTQCFCLYPYEPGDSPSNVESQALLQCTFKATPQSQPCEAPLWKECNLGDGRTRFVPRRRYLHQVLKAWVGRLICRPGIEDLLHKCQLAAPVDPHGPIPDIWFSKVFQGLVGPDGTPFFPGPPGEGRLVFSLSVDSFNPFHMKTAKQTVSSTGIWLVLLNLPPHLRYLPENVFLVGVLPDKPSTSQLNHAVALVVKDLLEFWDPGVTFTRSYKHRAGMLVRAMLVPLVCDMLAARQVLGLPGTATAHSFCTFCDIDIDDIDILDRSEWPEKDVKHIREFANYWKDASSEAHQKSIFEACGLRWSALLDLPYWNPVLYAVVDSMHALDLGLFQNHLRHLFRIDVEVKISGDGTSEPPPPTSKTLTSGDDRKPVRTCIELISEEPAKPLLLYELLRFRRKVLYTICVENDIRGPGHNLVIGTRWVLANNIFRWRHSADYDAVKLLSSATLYPDSQRPTPALETGTSTPTQPTLPDDGEIDISLTRRVISHLTNTEDKEESRRKAREQGTGAIFAYLCGILGITHSITQKSRGAKGKLFELVRDTIDQDPTKFGQLAAYVPAKSANRVVLGQDIMEVVWADMKRTQLPTWIRPAPPNWGTSTRGKLSADQYRVICTIHLVITLIRLWGRDTGRKKDMLRHFMDLVSAVQIANLRITSLRKIEAYNEFIFRYAQRCIDLFPDEDLKPTLHVALHMGDIMELFGPVHAYSSPFYERYINFFHRMNTNKKIGELESTFTQVAARSSNLRAMLSEDADLQATVQEMVREITATEREDARGYRLASLLDPHAADYVIDSKAIPMELSEDIFQHLQAIITASSGSERQPRFSRQALSVNKISSRGVTYGTSTSTTFKDSNILFQPTTNDTSDEPIAGTISGIFQHAYEFVGEVESHVTGFYLVVREFLPVDPATDPYREFGFYGGFLCSAAQGSTRVIMLSQVISHVVATSMEDGDYAGLIHVLPVDRLMLSFHVNASSDSQEAGIEEF